LAFIWKGICRDEAHGVGSLNPFTHTPFTFVTCKAICYIKV